MTLPKGFRIGTAGAGFRRPDRDDLGLIVSDHACAVAGVFTTNVFRAAPVLECQRILAAGGEVRAVLVNSGQANACTGDEGIEKCRETMSMVAECAGLPRDSILPMSTGVIGAQHKMDLWKRAVPSLVKSLGTKDAEAFAKSIVTTDAFPKFGSREVRLSGGTVRFTGMAKGAGMICPNMATMLSVVICDAVVDQAAWQQLFMDAVEKTFNRVTVDGDTSTNDTVLGLANGGSGIKVTPEEMGILGAALTEVLGELAYMLVQDGEGSTKVIRIDVRGAASEADAEKVARTVGHSQLVKTAMYGRDANWGRIVAAVGRSGASFRGDDVRVSLCGVELFRDGQPVAGDFEAGLAASLKERDVNIVIHMGKGPGVYVLLASDLSHDYVTCNADYRS